MSEGQFQALLMIAGAVISGLIGVLTAEWQRQRALRASKSEATEKANKLRTSLWFETLTYLTGVQGCLSISDNQVTLADAPSKEQIESWLELCRHALNNHDLLSPEEIEAYTIARSKLTLLSTQTSQLRKLDHVPGLPRTTETDLMIVAMKGDPARLASATARRASATLFYQAMITQSTVNIALWFLAVCFIVDKASSFQQTEKLMPGAYKPALWADDVLNSNTKTEKLREVKAAVHHYKSKKGPLKKQHVRSPMKPLREKAPLLFLIGLAVALFIVTSSAKGEEQLNPTINGPARVIDGDTIQVRGTRIRLEGVDAAELNTEEGKRARLAMRQIVGDSHIVCHLAGYKSYKREVATCFTLDGMDIGEELIRRGWAIEDTRFTNRYQAAESQAMGDGAGVWKNEMLSDAKWTLEVIGMLISAGGVILTVIFASKSAREGAVAGAAEQAALAEDAKQNDLQRKREGLKAILASEITQLANEIRPHLSVSTAANNQKWLQLGDLLPDPILTYQKNYNRLMPDVGILEVDLIRKLTDLSALCSKLTARKRETGYATDRMFALETLIVAVDLVDDMTVNRLALYLQFSELPEMFNAYQSEPNAVPSLPPQYDAKIAKIFPPKTPTSRNSNEPK